MMGESIATMLNGIPTLWKAITALVGAASVGASAMAFSLAGDIKENALDAQQIETRVTETEQRQDSILILLERLQGTVERTNCLQLAEARGDSWRTCLGGGG